jgi:hypothetical protein
VPPPLVPAAALALGLVPLATLLSATLLLHRPIEFVAIGLAIVVLACWLTLAGRIRREHPRDSRVRAHARGLLKPVRDLVIGEWHTGIPGAALVLSLAGGIIAVLVGYFAWNDSLYHIGQAQKLLALDAPTFSNTLQFTDGSAHPGYLIPAWQEVIALTAFVAHVDPVTAAWILPGITFPISMLAFGGLGWVLTRSRGATSVIAAALLVVTIGTLPAADAIVNAMHPGTIALGVLAPLVLAMMVTALWAEPDHVASMRRSYEVPAYLVARAATFLAAVATAGLGMLHVSYLWVLGLGILGYYLLWALRSPWPRAVVMRHLAVGATIAIVAGVVIALLLPGLNRMESLGRVAAAELAANDSPEYEGENAANLDALLRGDPEGAYHLRADYLVLAGGLALLGLLVVPIVVLAPRWPGGWYLAGSTLLVLAIALSDQLFPAFVNVVTLDQARRIERVLPLVLALGTGALAVGAAACALWRRGVAAKVAAGILVAVVVRFVARIADAVPPLAGYEGDRIVSPRVLTSVFFVIVALLVAGIVLRALRREPVTWTWPTQLLGGGATGVALAVLLVGAFPVYANVGDVTEDQRLEKLPIDMRTAELRVFAPNVTRELRRLPAGSVVLADPRSRNPYMAMAVAPVYVVSSVPRHTALTPENRVEERFELADSVFRDQLSRAQLRQLLLDEHVDAVIVHPFGAAGMQDKLRSLPGVRMGITGKLQRIWLIDRVALRRGSSRPSS